MRKNALLILSILLVFVSSMAFSALYQSLTITSEVQFRVLADIRVNGVSLTSTSGGAEIAYDSEYSKNTASNGFVLPTQGSSISYTVRIENSGGVDYAIYDMSRTTSDNGLQVTVSGYNLGDPIPAHSTLDLVITYTTTNPGNDVINVYERFDFRRIYYVSYETGTTDVIPAQIKYHGVNLTITSQQPNKPGYTFTTWNTIGDGSGTNYASGSTYSADEDKVLYAQYVLASYNITYTLNNGTVSPANPTTYHYTDPTITLNNPVKTLTFVGHPNATAAANAQAGTVIIGNNTSQAQTFAGWTGSNDLSGGLENYTISNPYTANQRNHQLGDDFEVTVGNTYRVFVTAKRTAGSLNMEAGLYYTERESGTAYEGWQGAFTKYSELGDGWGLYYKDVTVPAGKSKASFYIVLNQNADPGYTTTWLLADMHIIENNLTTTIPTNSYGDKAYTAHYISVGATLPTVTKTGHDCGWTTTANGTTKEYNSGATFPASAISESMASTVNIYAVCTPKTYTVTAQANGGTIASTTGWTGTGNSATKTVTYDSTYGTLPSISRTGYTFKGWSLLPEGYTQVEYITFTGEQTVDTGVSLSSYNGNYSIEVTEKHTSTSHMYIVFTSTNTPVESRANLRITGDNISSFVGSDSSPDTMSLPISIGEINNIKFDANSANSYRSLVVNGNVTYSNDPFISQPVPNVRISHAQSQMYSGNIYDLKIYGNGTLVRHLIPCTRNSDGKAGFYDIVGGSFYSNAATGTDLTAGSAAYITASTVVKDDRNHTIYAHWTPITYSIGYTLNGGGNPSPKPTTATYDADVNIGNPTKTFTVTVDGNSQGAVIKNGTGNNVTEASATQTFTGWTSSTISNTAQTGSTTSNYASWNGTTKTKNKYFKNLTNTDNGTVTMVANWTAVNVTLPVVEKIGYTCGYATSASGTVAYASGATYTPSTTTNSATLFVKCTANNYTVTANAQGGSITSTTGWTGTGNSATKTVTYGSTYGTLPSISRTGYTFKGWSLLPNGYRQVEYVEFTGSQYIDTGILSKQSLTIESGFSTTTASKLLFGARTSASASGLVFGYFASSSSYVGFGGGTAMYSTTLNPMNGSKHTVVLSNGIYTIDGVDQTISNRGTLSNFYNIYLGTWNNANTADNRMFVGKVYSFIIYDGDTIASYLVPCVNESTGKAGMYDVVSGTFLAPVGGDLTAGNASYITSSSVVATAKNHTIYAVFKDETPPVVSAATASTILDLRNYVDFTATDAGSGVAYYSINQSTTAPTTWIPVVSTVETTTETKYADNAAWARIFHQNNHWGSKYFANAAAAESKTDDNDLYSVWSSIDNYKNSTNWEFMLQYPEVSSTSYNRWTQTSDPTANTNSVTGYNAIHVDWTNGSWFGLALSSANTSTYIDGQSGGSWWYAIGAYTRYASGMPGPYVGSTATGVGTANVWARIDNLTNTTTTSLTRRIGDIAADGTYYVWAKDAAGNTAYKAVTINKVDTTLATASIASTNNVAASQTVTLTLGDNKGLHKYYFGTTNPVSNTNVSYTAISNNPTSSTQTATVSDGGTYYVSVVDTAGNRYNTNKVFYKTTLNANNGSVSPASVITMNGNSFTLPTPTRNGYNFVGWYTDSGLTTAVTLTSGKYKPTSSTTLYAKWTPINYNLTYALNNGTVSPANPSTYNIESSAITLNNPTKTLTFVGHPNATAEAYALEGTVSIGSNTTKAQTFAGWTEGPNLYSSTSTPYKASYYLKADGTETSNSEFSIYQITVKPNTAYTLINSGGSTSPAYVIYNSSGTRLTGAAYNNVDVIKFTTPANSSYIRVSVVTLATSNRYDKEVFKLIEDTASTTKTIPTGSTGHKSFTAHWTAVGATLPTVTRQGYDCGWTTTANGTTKQYASGATISPNDINESWPVTVNLYAVCTPKKIHLTLDPSPGSGGTLNVWYYYGTSKFYSDSACTTQITAITKPTRSGYTFTHYYGDGTSGGNPYERYIGYSVEFAGDLATDIYQDATLYAKWEKPVANLTNTLSPTSYIYDGTAKTPSVTVKDGTTTLTNNTDYTIAYSNNTNVGTASVTITGKDAFNSTTTAFYTGTTTLSYSITNAKLTFDKGTCDSVSGTATLYTRKNATAVYTGLTETTTTGTIPTATKTGYTFDGWFNSSGTKVLNANGTFTGTAVANYTNSNSWNTTANQTLYARCSLNSYALTVAPNGGSFNGSTSNTSYTQAYNTLKVLPMPTKTGYIFNGWTKSGSGTVTKYGVPKYTEPYGSVGVYNNSGGGTVVHTSVARSSDSPILTSSNMLQITTNGTASPGLGGFVQTTYSYENAVFYHVIVAKIPVGYTIADAKNSTGTGRTVTWLTPQAGTGKFEVYIYRHNCGSGGTFSTFGHVYINGTAATSSNPVTWYVAYAQMFDATTSTPEAASQVFTYGAGATTLTANWTPITYTVKYNGNGNTGGSTANSSHTYNTEKALTTNGFTKTGHTFAGWSTSASDKNLVYDNNEYSKDNSAGSSYANVKEHVITAPFASGEVYQLDFDAKGTGSLTTYFYGYSGYLQVASVTNSDGYTGTSTDGSNSVSLTSSYKHYTVRFTLGSNGTTTVNKILLFRVFSGNVVYFKNVRFNKVTSSSTAYSDGQTVKNLTTTNGATVNLYALWTANTYTVKYCQGSNNTNEPTCSSTTSAHTYGVSKALTQYSSLGLTAPSGWTFYGWSTSETGTTKTYDDKANVTNLATTGEVKLYAIFKRDLTFISGANSATSTSQTQYYNPYQKANTTYITSVTSPSSLTTISTAWTALGYRDDTTAGDKELALNTAVTPAYNSNATTYYGVYSRKITIYSGDPNSKTTVERTQYLNTYNNTVGSVSAPAPTTVTNWTALGYRDDTTADVKEYGSASAGNVTPPYSTGSVTLYAVYSRTLTISYNGNGSTSGSTAATTKTIYLNTNSTTTSSQAVTLASNGFAKTGHTFSNWNTNNTGTGTNYNAGASYTAGVAYNAGTFGATLYAKWSANGYQVDFYQGTTKLKSQTGFVYGQATALAAYSGTAPSGWTFAGWSTTTSGTAVSTAGGATLTNQASVSTLATSGTVNLYAIFRRDIIFKSGVSPGTQNAKLEQRYNPYNTSYVTSVTAPSSLTATNSTGAWTALGWRDDTTAGNKEYNLGASITPAYNATALTYYGVYSRQIRMYSGVSKATDNNSNKPTQYLNTYNNAVTAVSAPAPTAITNWTARGYRADTSAADQSYAVTTAAANISPAYNVAPTLYAVYLRSFTITYAGNGNTGGSTAANSVNVFMNTNSTTTSAQTITLAANGFTKTGHTFSKWTIDSTDYNAGASYTPATAVQYNASTFGKTATAKWSANGYQVDFYQGTTKLKSQTGFVYGQAKALDAYSGTAPSGWTFAGWSTTTSGTAVSTAGGATLTNQASVSTLATSGTVNLYAVFKRSIVFKSGVSAGTTNATLEQRYNPYSTSYVTSVTAPSSLTATNSTGAWTALGWRDDTTAGNKEYNLGASVTPAYNSTATTYYGVYSRQILIYSGVNKATSNASSKPTQYLNTSGNAVSAVSAPAPAAVSNWTARGYRYDTAAGDRHYAITTAAGNVSPAYNVGSTLYAVYLRSFTITYAGNGNTGGSTAANSVNVFMNTNSTATSAQTITLAANGFTKTGHTFSKWTIDSTDYNASTSYTPSTAVAYNAGTFGKTATAKWTANGYSVDFYQGSTKLKTQTGFTYGTAKALDAYSGTAPSGWTFAGWSTTTSGTTVNYANQASVSTLATSGTANLYAVFKRSIVFKSGVSAGTTNATLEQRYNPYSTSYVTSVTAPSSLTATNSTGAWTALGWRDDTTAGNKEVNLGGSVSPAYNSTALTYYGVYSRQIRMYSGVSKATDNNSNKPTQYLNTSGNAVSAVSAPAPTAITNWTARGYRADTSAADRSYAVTTAAANISPAYNIAPTLYAVYLRAFTITYAGNGNTGGSTAANSVNVFMNTNSTTTSAQTITLAANGFTKTGNTFSKWTIDSTDYNAGASYTPATAVAYNASTFGKTATAKWTVNTYKLTISSTCNSKTSHACGTFSVEAPTGTSVATGKTSYEGTFTHGTTYKITATAANGASAPAAVTGTLTAAASKTMAFTFTSITWNYEGSIKSWKVPVAGTYTIEAYGAQGGSTANNAGGKGGYVKGNKSLSTVGQQLYVAVGQQPTTSAGGYNGGGTGSCTGETGTYASLTQCDTLSGTYERGGGGASHVGTQNYLLASYPSANRSATYIYVVAGGGGGASQQMSGAALANIGGAGGASTGGTGGQSTSVGGTGGSQSAGGQSPSYNAGSDPTFDPPICTESKGVFGKGGVGCHFKGGSPATYYSGGGGGGWYGGGGGGRMTLATRNAAGGGGGGGSSYTGGLGTVTTNAQGNKTGNGQIKITWVS